MLGKKLSVFACGHIILGPSPTSTVVGWLGQNSTNTEWVVTPRVCEDPTFFTVVF